jgi:hypothetical protein
MKRSLIRTAHLAAGIIGFATILAFWLASIGAELFGDHTIVADVKQTILRGMFVLIPAMAVVGGTGFSLAGKSTAPIVVAKRRRMPAIALNGLVVLVPSAFFLAGRAAAGQFDATFAVVQAIELAAGATNLLLMGLNMRDGFRMTAKRRRQRRQIGAVI